MSEETIGRRLRRTREKLRYTQKEAAARLGIHNSTLGKYELDEREPDLDTLYKIAELYDVSPIWLVFGYEQEGTITNPSDKDIVFLLQEEASRLNMSPDSPEFRELLHDAIQLLKVARGKNKE